MCLASVEAARTSAHVTVKAHQTAAGSSAASVFMIMNEVKSLKSEVAKLGFSILFA